MLIQPAHIKWEGDKSVGRVDADKNNKIVVEK